jgi:hypothetical protein
MRTAEVKLNFHSKHFFPEDGSNIFIQTIGTFGQHYEYCTVQYNYTATPTLCRYGKLKDKLYFYLYHWMFSCRPLYCTLHLHLCCSWLRIPE